MPDGLVQLDPAPGTPKYLQLAAILRRDILQNRYAEGEKLRSVRELADQYGANKTTVNQTMQHLAREGLIELREKKGCFVRKREPRSIAVVFDRNIYQPGRTPYSTLLLSELEHCIHDRGWVCRPFLNTSDWAWDEFRRVIDARQCDVVISASSMLDEALLATLRRLHVPAIGAYLLDRFDHYVTFDAFELGRRGIDALIAAGARTIGLIHGPVQFGRDRGPCPGYRAGLEAHGIAYDPELVCCVPFDKASGAEACASLLTRHPRLDGLLVADELLMKGAARTLIARTVAVPGQLAVASQVSVELDDPFVVPVIQLRNRVPQQAQHLVDLALALADGQPVHNSMIEIPPLVHDPCTVMHQRDAAARALQPS